MGNSHEDHTLTFQFKSDNVFLARFFLVPCEVYTPLLVVASELIANATTGT
jgi:hypothetical protein